jgi:hypothetical protein
MSTKEEEDCKIKTSLAWFLFLTSIILSVGVLTNGC